MIAVEIRYVTRQPLLYIYLYRHILTEEVPDRRKLTTFVNSICVHMQLDREWSEYYRSLISCLGQFYRHIEFVEI